MTQEVEKKDWVSKLNLRLSFDLRLMELIYHLKKTL